MLDRLWTTFRTLPGWAQALAWLGLWPVLGALFLWRRPGAGKGSKIGAVALLLLGTFAYAGALTPAATETAPPRATAKLPSPDPTPVLSPTPSSSPFPSLSPEFSPSPAATAWHRALAVPGGIPAGAQKAKVAKNVDGDTIWAEPIEHGSLALGATHKIRILEIDTPEIYGGTVECYGPEASAFAKQELPVGSTIYLLADKEDTDRYGRFLRYVWREDGRFYNDMAVRQGFARAMLYMPNDLYINQIREAEAEAKANNRGLWGACSSSSSGATTTAPPPPPSGGNCHASYPDFCIPPPPPDKNCADFSQKNFTVRWDVPGPDPHKLDSDKDGEACES